MIGTLAAQALEHKQDVIVSTGDKDIAQLVNEHVSLINTMNDVFMDVAGVNEKFGVPPEHIIEYLALMGDKVDNILACPKLVKRPRSACQRFRLTEDIYANLDKVKEPSFRGKTLAPKLEEHKDQVSCRKNSRPLSAMLNWSKA